MMDWLCGVQLVYRSMLLVWEQSFFLVWLCLLRSNSAFCSERKSRILLMIRSNHSHLEASSVIHHILLAMLCTII